MPQPIVHLSFAPLAHAMERQHIGIILPLGGKIGFYQGVRIGVSRTHRNRTSASCLTMQEHYNLHL